MVIGLTSGGAGDSQRASLAALIAIERDLCGRRRAHQGLDPRRLGQRAEGLLLGAAAGALWGVSDVALKYLTQAPPGPLLGLVSPWTLTALIAGVIAFYACARSLQIGQGVEVIALTSVTATLTAILGGILVFHEPIGSGPLGITARFLAFCLVIAGAASCPPRCAPPPTRASAPRDQPTVTGTTVWRSLVEDAIRPERSLGRHAAAPGRVRHQRRGEDPAPTRSRSTSRSSPERR
jgi:hypothetical protein